MATTGRENREHSEGHTPRVQSHEEYQKRSTSRACSPLNVPKPKDAPPESDPTKIDRNTPAQGFRDFRPSTEGTFEALEFPQSWDSGQAGTLEGTGIRRSLEP
jgi:hypothetical protein